MLRDSAGRHQANILWHFCQTLLILTGSSEEKKRCISGITQSWHTMSSAVSMCGTHAQKSECWVQSLWQRVWCWLFSGHRLCAPAPLPRSGPAAAPGPPSWRRRGSECSRRPSLAPPAASCCSWPAPAAASLAAVHLETGSQPPIRPSPTGNNGLMALDWIITAVFIKPLFSKGLEIIDC